MCTKTWTYTHSAAAFTCCPSPGEVNQLDGAGQQFADHVGHNGVRSEDQPRPHQPPCSSPACPSRAARWPSKTSANSSQRPSGRHQHIGAGPHLLVEREPDRPQISQRQAGRRARQPGPASLLFACRLRAQPQPGQQSEQRGAERGNIAQQSLGIARIVRRPVFIEMARHQLPVNPRHNVLVLVEERNVAARHARSRHRNPAHQHPVANQHTQPAPQPLSTRADPTDRTAPRSGSRWRCAAARRRSACARDGNSGKLLTTMPNSKQNARAPHRVPRQLGARVAARQPRLRRKHDRHAHHEQKRGKNQVGGRESVPRGVMHLAPMRRGRRCCSP